MSKNVLFHQERKRKRRQCCRAPINLALSSFKALPCSLSPPVSLVSFSLSGQWLEPQAGTYALHLSCGRSWVSAQVRSCFQMGGKDGLQESPPQGTPIEAQCRPKSYCFSLYLFFQNWSRLWNRGCLLLMLALGTSYLFGIFLSLSLQQTPKLLVFSAHSA